ncbi:MAG: hypothetical protein RJB01_1349 [Actinomycetota bacterium]
MHRTRVGAALAAVAVAALALTACSSGSPSDAESETTAAAADDATGDSAGVGDGIEITDENLNMLAPIMIVPEQTEAEAVAGDFVDIMVDDPINTTVTSSDPAIIDIAPGREEDGVLYNPGGQALAAGNATLSVTLPDGTSYDIALTVSE